MKKTQKNITHACLRELMKMVIRQANQIEDLKMANTLTDDKLMALDSLVTKVFAEISVEITFLKEEIKNNGVTEAGMQAIANIETKLANADAERPDIVTEPTEPVGPTQPEVPAEPVLDENGNPIA